MGKFRERFSRFMIGRYGVDQFAKFTMYISLALLVITLFWHNTFVYIVAVGIIVYSYFRILSRNISKRYAENQAYLRIYYKVSGKIHSFTARLKDQKTHKIFKCPGCSQKIRVPRGKGKISIKCPKCRIEFVRKT